VIGEVVFDKVSFEKGMRVDTRVYAKRKRRVTTRFEVTAEGASGEQGGEVAGGQIT
jgi:hypothetical protein